MNKQSQTVDMEWLSS